MLLTGKPKRVVVGQRREVITTTKQMTQKRRLLTPSLLLERGLDLTQKRRQRTAATAATKQQQEEFRRMRSLFPSNFSHSLHYKKRESQPPKAKKNAEDKEREYRGRQISVFHNIRREGGGGASA